MSTRFSLTFINLCVLLFALSAILGVLPAYDAALSAPSLGVILFSVALYFAVAGLARTLRATQVVHGLLLIITVIFALYFVAQYGHLGYEKGGLIARLGALTSFLPDLNGFRPQSNAAATLLEAGGPLGVALAVSLHTRGLRMVATIGVAIVIYAVFLTASRGAWLALAMTAGVAVTLAISNRLPRRTATLLIVVGGVLIAVAVLAIIELGSDRLPLLSSTFSRASDRGRLFLNSLYLAGDYAFTGIGLGDTFAMVYSRYSLLVQVPFLTYAHNLPLSIWLNQGLLGLIAFGAMVIAFYVFVQRVRRSAAPPATFHGAWLAVTATLLHGLIDAPQYAAGSYWVMPMLFASLGLTVAAGRLASREAGETGVRRNLRPLAIGASLALAALVVIFNRPIRAAWHTNLAAIDETRAELAPGLAPGQRSEGYAAAQRKYADALAIDPGWANANRRLGNLSVSLDQFEVAVPLLEAAFARETSNPAAIKGLGLAYVWLGRTQAAARMFMLLDNPADLAEELFTWANYRSEQHRPLLSAYALETALTLFPKSASLDLRLLVADTYRVADRIEAARLWYNRVLEVDPDNQRALEALADLGQ